VRLEFINQPFGQLLAEYARIDFLIFAWLNLEEGGLKRTLGAIVPGLITKTPS
jgi:hypothetical protein